MPDLAVSNDTEIITQVQKTAEILMIFKVHTHGEQTVDLIQLHNNVTSMVAGSGFYDEETDTHQGQHMQQGKTQFYCFTSCRGMAYGITQC